MTVVYSSVFWLIGVWLASWIGWPPGVWLALALLGMALSIVWRKQPFWAMALFCLGGIAAFGYYYTAFVLDQPVQRTIILGLVLIITSNIL